MENTVRIYQPVTPSNNQYLAQRWDQEIFNAHRKKVIAAKAVIDNMPPRVHMHLHIKLKKLQFEAERLATIERDNRMLLEKMAHIVRTGGMVDHKKQDHKIKSLNKMKRQRELLRISHENLAILRRLMTKDPHYNHKNWIMQWRVNQQYLMNISKYDHSWRQELSPYLFQVQRKSSANKHVTRKINTPKKPVRASLVKKNPDSASSNLNTEPEEDTMVAILEKKVKPEVADRPETETKSSSMRIDTGNWHDIMVPDSDIPERSDGGFNVDRNYSILTVHDSFMKVINVDHSEADEAEEEDDKNDNSVQSLEITSVVSEELGDYDEY